jgi:hypothetical protein
MRDKNNEPQGPNLMVSRHGATYGHTCIQCRHLSREGSAPNAGPWYCEMLMIPSGRQMPWSDANRACGLFEERTKR